MCHFCEQFHFTACGLVSLTVPMPTMQKLMKHILNTCWFNAETFALNEKHGTSKSILKQEKSKWWMQYFEEMDNILRGVISSLRVEEWRIRKSNSFGMFSILHLPLMPVEIGWICFPKKSHYGTMLKRELVTQRQFDEHWLKVTYLKIWVNLMRHLRWLLH